jgi:CheY-like chemotaxis protein
MTASSPPKKTLKSDLSRPVRILLVEDSPSDAAMTEAALREGRIANEMHTVGDGEQAVAYLRREGAHGDALRPDLILLDLNLPRKDGREVLAEIKADPNLKAIPVVILTTSSAEADVCRAYELYANAYVTKPVGYDAFLEAIHEIEGFWLSLVRFADGAE